MCGYGGNFFCRHCGADTDECKCGHYWDVGRVEHSLHCSCPRCRKERDIKYKAHIMEQEREQQAKGDG